MLDAALAKRFAKMEPEEQWARLKKMTARDLLRFDVWFEMWAHKHQLPPGGGWRTWMMLAGRGFGKTRAGAEWITGLAKQRREVRIALVGATIAEARSVMVEGPSGLLRVAAIHGMRPKWEPSLGRIAWPGGAIAELFSGDNADGLRGPEHHYAWCDELAKWGQADAAWDNLQLGLRAGERPRALVTTTPRPIPLIERILRDPWAVATRGRTDENINLPDQYLEVMQATYAGTRLGRQELGGEILTDADGALWTRAMMEACRLPHPNPSPEGEGLWRRIVIGVDPPGSVDGDACGIVVAGLGEDGVGYVIADHSVAGLSPEGWASVVARAAVMHGADRVVVERNFGGDMVAATLRGAAPRLPVSEVTASRGKTVRAEPVAALFERGEAKLLGTFPALEDELCGMIAGGRYEGPGRSPDRADAMVWAFTELMLGEKKAEPRVMVL